MLVVLQGFHESTKKPPKGGSMKEKKAKTQETREGQNTFVFMKPLKVSKTSNGNLLIYLNHTSGISLHPNFIKAVLEGSKKEKAS